MASDEIRITLPEDENEKLKPSEEADVGPSTSKKPLDEKQIQLTNDEKEIQLTKDETEKLKLLLAEVDSRPVTSDKPLIQEVTHTLRSCYTTEECQRYFEPTYVVLGPLHHEKKSRLERGEMHKRRLAASFINLTDGGTEVLYKNVKKEINFLRDCYNLKGQEWNDEDLAFMFLVDGCALLLFILLEVTVGLQEFIGADDLVGIERVDFFLLENQLPYRLLEILIDSSADFSKADLREIVKKFFKKSINEFINRVYLNLTAQDYRSQPHHPYEQQQRKKFAEISSAELRQKLRKFFKESISKFINRICLNLTVQQQHPTQVDQSEPHHPNEQQKEEQGPVHLLDLLRRRMMGVKSKENGEKHKQISKGALRDIWENMDRDTSHRWHANRNVTELKDKGICFKAREKEGAITDVDFNDRCFMRTFKLVPIFSHNTTVPILLNLIAYELCPDFQETCDITSYLSFLDSLIDNGEDVKELKDAGVLHNGLGSDEAVAELFNKISGILMPNLKIDSGLRRNIHEYCSNKSHLCSLCASIQAKLTHTYFRSPWSFFVFFGALAGLVMTGMQTYYGFHQNQPHY